MRPLRTILVFPVVILIRFYQYAISPMIPPRCRYLPTCSEYCKTSFLKHGFKKGFVLSIKRVGKCHPWGGSGYDPVP